MLARGIAMENLQQKQRHRGDGVQQPIAPRGVVDSLASGPNGLGWELKSPLGRQSLERDWDAGYHVKVSWQLWG
jgi:hypothetical protein